MSNELCDHDEEKPKKRSLVWKFFEKISRNRVRCLICRHEQNYQGTTGNILRHLKARHELDATLKGQQQPHNQQRIIELSSIALLTEKQEFKFETKPKTQKSPTYTAESSSSDEKEININQEFKEDIYNKFVSIPELDEDCLGSTYVDTDVSHRKSERRIKLEEDRIIAETEYFREKAAFFRIQKHLTALQARKVKIELEQVTGKKQTSA